MKIKIKYTEEKGIREWLVLRALALAAPVHLLFNHKSWNINEDQLLKYPCDSLGHELALFYKEQNLNLLPGIEHHDVLHVLLGYSTKVKGESAMQFFLLGNGCTSLSTIGSTIASALLFPDMMSEFMREYNKGKHCTNISEWNLQLLLNSNTNSLKSQIFKTKTL